jgi:DNA-binding transcriptional LysR family regulator
MELRHLRYFIAVAEEGNMHKAAQRLHISQPPLSLSIKQMEEEIGTPLFDRIGRIIQLNNAGKTFLEHAHRTIKDHKDAMENARLIGEGKQGIVKIGFISSAITGILQQLVSTSIVENPDIELDISQSVGGMIGDQILSEEYDIGLVRYPENIKNGLASKALTKEHWDIVFPECHHFKELQTVTIKDLKNEKLIFYPRWNSPSGHDDIMSLFHEKGITPNIVQEAPEQMTIAGLASVGLGIGIVPSCMRNISMKGLCHRTIEGTKERTGFSLLYKETPSPLVRTFLNSITQL